jgi:transposase
MGKKHFTEEQIAFALRQAESGTSVAEIIRKLGISEQTFYRWKKRFRKSRVAHQQGNVAKVPLNELTFGRMRGSCGQRSHRQDRRPFDD